MRVLSRRGQRDPARRPETIALPATWHEFKTRYIAEVLPGMAVSTRNKQIGLLAEFAEITGPELMQDLSAKSFSRFIAERRRQGCAETTIRGDLGHIRSALNWAVRQNLLHEVPAIDLPRRGRSQKVMKGRPVTQAEFDQMLGAITDPPPRFWKKKCPCVPEFILESPWRWLLRGLWWGGLRLSEAVALSWEPAETGMSLDFSLSRPMLRIPADSEKGHQERLMPLPPEFAIMLEEVPREQRVGLVFPLPLVSQQRISSHISELGRLAGIVVHRDSKRIKYASAHDLRRSFGERWAMRVMPQVLMQLMRHESIETTMRYYVGRNAEAVAEVLWNAVPGQSAGLTRAPADSR